MQLKHNTVYFLKVSVCFMEIEFVVCILQTFKCTKLLDRFGIKGYDQGCQNERELAFLISWADKKKLKRET